MEKILSALEIHFIVKELRAHINGGFIRKIYGYYDNSFLIEVFVPGKGTVRVYFDSSKIMLTEHKKQTPEKPPLFCSILRKHIEGKRIVKVVQHEFERVVEIHFEDKKLIIELFGNGNVVLCDNDNIIISALHSREWRDRAVKPKMVYEYPPLTPTINKMDFDEFAKHIKRENKKIVVMLASMGFGGTYAREICKRSGIDDQKISEEMNMDELLSIYKTALNIIDHDIKAILYEDDATPFPLTIYEGKKVVKECETFSSAVDILFFSDMKKEVRETEAAEKARKVLERQREAMAKWKRVAKESRKKADVIYENYSLVESVLNGIQRAINSGMTWSEIKKRVREEDSAEAASIKEIKENQGIVVLDLKGMNVSIEFNSGVNENAALYYEKAKQATRKIEGIMRAMKEHEEKLKSIELEKIHTHEQVKRIEKKKWYEKFRYFHTSDGFLVIAGRDATSNEVLIKKYTEGNDLVLHADVAGASFVVIKSNGKEISDTTKKEAATFAAVYNKAWQRKLSTIDVYCVAPEQVSKKSPSGEYLAKGSFMIYGEREWFRNVELKLAIGVVIKDNEAEVIAGPESAIKAKTGYYLIIAPGDMKTGKVAKEIKSRISDKVDKEKKGIVMDIPLEEFQKWVPGNSNIVRHL